MLNADSSTLNRESDDQSRNAPPTIPSEVALRWIARITATMLEIDAPGKPEQREGEEEQRYEGQEGEVGDHRREVRAPVGEELREGFANVHCVSVCPRWRRRKRYRS